MSEHECGGPKEACMIPGCEECGAVMPHNPMKITKALFTCRDIRDANKCPELSTIDMLKEALSIALQHVPLECNDSTKIDELIIKSASTGG